MSRYRVFAVTVLFAWGAVYGQTVAVELAFSVASVKRVPLGASVYEETPESIRYRCALINLVQRAYELAPYQLVPTNPVGNTLAVFAPDVWTAIWPH